MIQSYQENLIKEDNRLRMKKNEMDIVEQKKYMTPNIEVTELPLSEILTESGELQYDNCFEDDFFVS